MIIDAESVENEDAELSAAGESVQTADEMREEMVTIWAMTKGSNEVAIIMHKKNLITIKPVSMTDLCLFFLTINYVTFIDNSRTAFISNASQILKHEDISSCANYDIKHIVTPVKVDVLERLLKVSKYDKEETDFLVNGFRNGFDIKYEGPEERKDC